MKQTIIYIRTSTEEQNPENQLSKCETLNHYGDYLLIKDQQSAFKDNKERKGFKKLEFEIKSGHVNNLICWDLDRLYRNRIKLKQFFELCKIYKCKIHSVNQQWLEQLNDIPEPFNEIMHDLMLNLMGWLGEDESKKKSERVKLAVRKEEGKQTKSYKGNRWGRKPLNIKEGILKLRDEGKSIREITKEIYYWDKNHHRKYVSIGYVAKVLKNEN